MDTNSEKNRIYYAQLPEDAVCNCIYCRNYCAQVKCAYPEAAAYLLRLGIDIEKPLETSPLEPENGKLEYCVCQYVAFGSCPDTYSYKIGDVEFSKAASHPNTGIAEPHFVLDLGLIVLKADFGVSD